jgi:hypothetical protein
LTHSPFLGVGNPVGNDLLPPLRERPPLHADGDQGGKSMVGQLDGIVLGPRVRSSQGRISLACLGHIGLCFVPPALEVKELDEAGDGPQRTRPVQEFLRARSGQRLVVAGRGPQGPLGLGQPPFAPVVLARQPLGFRQVDVAQRVFTSVVVFPA